VVPVQKINPYLWFDTQAETAVDFYLSVFPQSKKKATTYYSPAFAERAGTVMTVSFELFGQEFIALNGGPQFSFTPAISLLVHCESQREVDELWEKLTEGGKPGRCGWLEDRFGVTWQVVPDELFVLLADPSRAERVTQSMLTMAKIDVEVLKRA
jgi:predicted 3-demethylubiquinone-9 3-methyltransferase (glyoxalase superfamily)